MEVIKLNATDSTNTYLKNLAKTKLLADGLIVMAHNQTAGRGQLDATWVSSECQSLTFSIFKRFSNLVINDFFAISMATSIAVNKTLKILQVPGSTIKWPNDIMSYSKKIGGILIENQIEYNLINSSIIGVGINVLQRKFDQLPAAASILMASGQAMEVEEVFQKIAENLLMELKKPLDLKKLKVEYEKILFRKNHISVFESQDGDRFNGMIQGISDQGKLLVEMENAGIREFDLKEIKMLL